MSAMFGNSNVGQVAYVNVVRECRGKLRLQLGGISDSPWNLLFSFILNDISAT